MLSVTRAHKTRLSHRCSDLEHQKRCNLCPWYLEHPNVFEITAGHSDVCISKCCIVIFCVVPNQKNVYTVYMIIFVASTYFILPVFVWVSYVFLSSWAAAGKWGGTFHQILVSHFCWPCTLQETNISHLGKRKIIFKRALVGDMLLPRRVIFDRIGVLHFFADSGCCFFFFSDGSEMKWWSYTGYCLTASWTRDPMAQEMTWHKTPEMSFGTWRVAKDDTVKDVVFVEVIETSTHDHLSHAITPLHVVRREVVIWTWRNERPF